MGEVAVDLLARSARISAKASSSANGSESPPPALFPDVKESPAHPAPMKDAVPPGVPSTTWKVTLMLRVVGAASASVMTTVVL